MCCQSLLREKMDKFLFEIRIPNHPNICKLNLNFRTDVRKFELRLTSLVSFKTILLTLKKCRILIDKVQLGTCFYQVYQSSEFKAICSQKTLCCCWKKYPCIASFSVVWENVLPVCFMCWETVFVCLSFRGWVTESRSCRSQNWRLMTWIQKTQIMF